MTVVTEWYDALRADGVGHTASLKRLGRRIGVDPDTVMRTLSMADHKRFPLSNRTKERQREKLG